MFEKRNLRKIAAGFLSAAMLTGLMAGCAAKNEPSQPAQPTAAPTTAQEPVKEGPLPIVAEPLTLTYWSPLKSKPATTCVSLNEVAAYEELEKRTGIHIDFMHPPVGQETDQFNLMISSGDFPDMIYHTWSSVPGGPAKYINDGIIYRLNDLIDGKTPYLQGVYEQYPMTKKQNQLDDGTVYMFPFMKPDSSILTYYGPQMRKDWLDKYGLSIPVTIDDWYTALKTFKTQDANGNGQDDEVPFVSIKLDGVKWFAVPFGIKVRMDTESRSEFYQENGKVKFGPLEDGFKDYLTEMRKWYTEGLIDPDFAATDETQLRAKVTGNQAGAYFGGASGYMGRFLNQMKETQPEFNLTAVQYPAGKAGINYNTHPDVINSIPGEGAAITVNNKHLEETVKWFDYQYSDEGVQLMNFGIEGESYTMVNGEPIYTDVIMKNQDGLTPDVAVAKYTVTFGGTTLYASGYYKQMLALPQQQEALKIWGNGDFSMTMPPITPTSEESQKLATIMNEVNTYVDEMLVRYIMGQDDVDNFEEFRANLKEMNIDEAIGIAQAALDRYNARK